MLKYEWAKGKDSNGHLVLFSFGGNYFFNDHNHAPYANLDIGYGSASDKFDRDSTGWGYAVGAGMKFFRTATVNFAIEVKYTSIVEEIQGTIPSRTALKFVIFY